MFNHKFYGTGVAIVTPFHQTGEVDWLSFEKIINHIINGTCEYLVVLGTTGESATINTNEKQQIFSFVNKINNNRVPLVAGIGGNDTQEVIQLFKHFNLTGYDAILSVSPYYNKPNQQGLYRHYTLLDANTPLPIIMYNVPSRTGQNITAETQLLIAQNCKNIFATKEASGNLDQINKILKDKPEHFLVISGDDGLTLPMIACGACGVISVVANAYPKNFSQMVQFALKGNYKEAQQIHFQFMDIISALFAEGSPSGIKAFLTEMDLCKNFMRSPVSEVSDSLHLKLNN